MPPERVLEVLRASGAVLNGHFRLVSGLHSPVYFQIARLFTNPVHTVEIAGALGSRDQPQARRSASVLQGVH
jgi:orotate phosphoribosyltransferase